MIPRGPSSSLESPLAYILALTTSGFFIFSAVFEAGSLSFELALAVFASGSWSIGSAAASLSFLFTLGPFFLTTFSS